MSTRPSVAPTPAMAERLRAEEALRRSESRNQALLSAIPDLILQIQRDGTLLDCHVGELAPYRPPDQLLGKKIDEVLPAEVAHQAMQFAARTLQTGQTQVYEHQLPSLTGVRDYETRMVVSGEDEVLFIIRDITEQKRAIREAARSERLAALGLLATALAHEINNPLQILESHLDLVLDFPVTPDERAKSLQVMRIQLDRLNAVTRRVLNYAHPRPVERRPVRVIRSLVQVLGFAGKQLQQKGVRVTTDFKDVPPVLAVPDQLEQVLLNLVINAMESVPAGSGHLRVAVYPDGNQVVIALTNNGPRIPGDVLPHIFEAFYTTRPEGSGLGLWISQKLIEEHGGSLSVENLPADQGAVFKVLLPAAPAID